MKFWQFGYRKGYYLTHPFTWLDDFYRSLKYAVQRAVRGWDDPIVWGIDDYLCEMLPVWLCRLKQNKIGVPVEFSVEGDDDKLTQASAQWNGVLDEMIAGFEAGSRLVKNNLPIYEEAEILTGYGNIEAFCEMVDNTGGHDRIEQEIDALGAVFDLGMRLFHKHFFDLWD